LEFVYEAGPSGFALYRQLEKLGHHCAVIAPSWTPVKPGEKVKTDRKDAEKLAWYWRMRDLKEVHIPSCEEEADRDLVRAREDLLSNQLRARHRMLKFLARNGRVNREGRNWTQAHRAWMRKQTFEWENLTKTFESNLRSLEEADAHLRDLTQDIEHLAQEEKYRMAVGYLRCLRGVDILTAMTLLVESGDFKRFGNARGYMRYTGMVSRENSSSERIYRGAIVKSGNAHIRRVLVQAAWTYRRGYHGASKILMDRRRGQPSEVVKLACKAERRLTRKFNRLTGRGKLPQVAVISIAREMSGFVWAIGQMIPSGC
jgi:transposase